MVDNQKNTQTRFTKCQPMKSVFLCSMTTIYKNDDFVCLLCAEIDLVKTSICASEYQREVPDKMIVDWNTLRTHRGRTIRKMYGAHLNAQDAWLRNSYSTIICSFCLPNMGAKPAPTTSLTRNCWMCCQLVATSPQMVANHHQTSIAWEHKAIKPLNH